VANPAPPVQPLSELDSLLALERFDYSRVGEHWAVLRLLASLGSDLGAPAQAMLVVQRGPASAAYPARACALERRLIRRPGSDRASELLWRASFAVPLEVVEYQQARFEFTVSGRVALALPVPGLRILTPSALRFSGPQVPPSARSRMPVGQARRRLVALATAVAVTTSSTPAVGLAATQAVHDGSATNAATRPATTVQRADHVATAHTRTALSSVAGHGRRSRAAATASRHATAPATRPPAVTHLFSAPAQPAPAQPATAAPCKPKHPAPGAGSSLSAALRSTSTLPATSGAATAPKCTDPATPEASTHHSGHPRTGGPGANGAAQRNRPGAERSGRPGVVGGSDGGANLPNAPGAGSQPPAAGASGNQPPAAGASGNQPPATGGTGNPTTAGSGNVPAAPDPGNVPAAASGGSGAATPSDANVPVSGGGGQDAHGHQHRGAHIQDPNGGAPLQPMGGLNPRPPVKLASRPAARHTPATATPTPSATPTLSPAPPQFTAPQAWTGTSTIDPNLSGALTDLSGLLANGNQPPPFLIPIYMEAGRRYDVPWEVLAAINAVETDYGRDLSTSSAGAIGWMQFEPASWREYGMAVDGHSVANPYDPRDAIFAAARLLAAAGAAKSLSGAVFSYNHATWYVNEVLSRAQAIADDVRPAETRFTRGIASVAFESKGAKHGVATFKGGYLWHYDRLIATANMVSAANFPYLYGGGHEQPSVFAPFDCSGAVSYVMQQSGYKVPTTVSGDIASWGFPAGPGAVTIFYNPTHTFMRIGNRFFGTSGFARPGGGAGWFDTDKLPASYLAEFSEVHVPRLGPNSFAPVAATPGAADSSAT